ncbi:MULTISPECIES: RNA polymerase sigma factor [Galbibacter]|uniref:RNA polymerase sigma factor n=1 Tax=Galbibacter pacificus TaxID=2996052 RepID=A0ABT6FUL5_9FLAO|nr:RNA polymerase sigma factor [Galbibacter pacificus]MDG3583310.1 RNA polymerase sigma factor [Galbibacter pacificus]MDG3586791.1 RNA polymerase sigma factor [Galbibacter pacificus]
MSLEQLIKQCKRQNRKAQEQLYKLYSSKLFSVCLKYSRNKTEAEDNLHDSFMVIFNKIDTYNFRGSFEGWMKRVTVNTVLQKYRKESALDALPNNLEADIEVELPEEDISLNYLLKLIQELPDRYRLTFNLYVLDGYSHKEIAEMLQINEGTSKSNLARAKMALRNKIEEDELKNRVNSV